MQLFLRHILTNGIFLYIIAVYDSFILALIIRYVRKYIGNTFKKGGELMNITDIRVKKIPSEGKMRAVVSVTFDDAFVVHDIKIIEGQEKLFTAMPSRRTPENEFKDIAHPINSEMRETLEKAIIAKYEELVAEEA